MQLFSAPFSVQNSESNTNGVPVLIEEGNSLFTMIFKKSPQISSNVSILKFYSLGGCVSRKAVLNGFFGYNGQPFSPFWREERCGPTKKRLKPPWNEGLSQGEKALNSLSDSLKSCFFQTEKLFSLPVSRETQRFGFPTSEVWGSSPLCRSAQVVRSSFIMISVQCSSPKVRALGFRSYSVKPSLL